MIYFLITLGLFLIAISLLLRRSSLLIRSLGLNADALRVLRASIIIGILGLLLIAWSYPKTVKRPTQQPFLILLL